MTKPNVPDGLMPSQILCYAPDSLAPEAHALIERCEEICQTRTWHLVDQVAHDAKQLGGIGVTRCGQAVVLVHLADAYWKAGMYEPALTWYQEADNIFSTLCNMEHRHNQAATAYGLGLVYHATGKSWQARRVYNEALELLDDLRVRWANDGNEARFYQCQRLSAHIEAVKRFLMDSISGGARDSGTARTHSLGSPFPTLLGTVPKDGTSDVPIDTPIVLAFDRPMQNDGLRLDIQPRHHLGYLPEPQWWEDDTVAVVRLTDGLLDYATQYEITITGARDRGHSPIEARQIPTGFRFTTQEAPGARSYLLDSLGVGRPVPKDAPIVLIFGEEMDPNSFPSVLSFSAQLVEPNPGDVRPQWDDGHRVLTIEHHPFPDPPTPAGYPTGIPGVNFKPRVNLAGITTRAGDPLKGPRRRLVRPWLSIPARSDEPKMIGHWPRNAARDIPVDMPFVILFSKKMDNVVCKISPRLPVEESLWRASRRVLLINHTNLLHSTQYKITLHGQDRDGQDLPRFVWRFTTRSMTPPAHPILGVTPADGIEGVPVEAKPLVVFGRPVSTNSADFQWRPRDSSCKVSWDAHPSGRIVTIHPSPGLIKGEKLHKWEVNRVCDEKGTNLLLAETAHSWSYETGPVVAAAPRITRIEPASGLLNVPTNEDVKISFSEPMDPYSLDVEVLPEPANTAVEWDVSRREATIKHAEFESSQTYRVLVRGACAQNGARLDVSSGPVALSFTTQAVEEPTVCYAYPRHGDVDIPLDAFLCVMFSQPMKDFAQRLGRIKNGRFIPVKDSPPLRWNAERTVLRAETLELQADTDYEIRVSDAPTAATGDLDLGKLSPVNPWRFRTVKEPPGRRGIETLDLIFLGFVLLLVLIIGSIVLSELVNWPASIGFAVAFPTTIFLLPRILRKLGVLFYLAPHEQAVVQQRSDLVVIRGPASYVWRVPFVENLRAIVPLRLFRPGIQSCRVQNADKGDTELSIALEYRVFGSVAAYQLFLDSCEKKEKEAKVYSSEQLRPVWEKRLGQLAKAVASDSLRNMCEKEIKNRRQTIEREITLLLNQTTHRWGIEIQDFELAEIKPAKEA